MGTTFRNAILFFSAAGLIVLLAWKSVDNYTPWEWLSSLTLFFIAVHAPYAINQLRSRYTSQGLTDFILDSLGLLAVISAILALPELRLTLGLLAVHHYFSGTRLYRCVTSNKGLRRHYASVHFNLNGWLNVTFALLAIAGYVAPDIATNAVLSLLLFVIIVVGGTYTVLMLRAYAMPRHG